MGATNQTPQRRWLMAGLVGGLTPAALAVPGNGNGNGQGNGNGNGNGNTAETLEITGVVRDFRAEHPDFDVVPPEGYGHYMWNIFTELDVNRRPVYQGGGAKVLQQAHDIIGRPISWTLYNPDLGDTPAAPDGPDSGNITSATTFAQWFRDIPGVNMSTLVTLSGPLVEDGEYAGLYEINEPQFYPIDGLLFGNDAEHNNFFTVQVTVEFTYYASENYVLMFKSDDAAWVFLDDRLVADLGGVNGSPEQWIDLNRPDLELEDGATYRFHFFKSDRSDASSRFHLVTNIPFQSVLEPTILAQFD